MCSMFRPFRKDYFSGELTAAVLNALLEKMEVHNSVMVNRVKEQKLTVYYKFVGQNDESTYK